MNEMSISAWQCKKRIKKLSLYLSSYVYNYRHNAVGQNSLRIHSYFKKLIIIRLGLDASKNPAWTKRVSSSLHWVIFILIFSSFLGYLTLFLCDQNNDMPAFETLWLPQFFFWINQAE